jgi:hypothetical protein
MTSVIREFNFSITLHINEICKFTYVPSSALASQIQTAAHHLNGSYPCYASHAVDDKNDHASPANEVGTRAYEYGKLTGCTRQIVATVVQSGYTIG